MTLLRDRRRQEIGSTASTRSKHQIDKSNRLFAAATFGWLVGLGISKSELRLMEESIW
jgi:hypothetical protein